jgi:hypothetical protein
MGNRTPPHRILDRADRLRVRLHQRRIDHRADLDHHAVLLELDVEGRLRQTRFGQVDPEPEKRGPVWHRIVQLKAAKAPEAPAVRKGLFEFTIGRAVSLL